MDDSQFREIFEKSPIGIIFHEKKGILTDINQSALDILGISSLNAVKDVNLFDNPEITSRKKELLNKGIINFQAPLDFDNIKNIGLYDPTKSRIGFIDYIVSTTDSGFIVQIQDITEHKKADEALKESEDKFSKAWHSNSAAMTITRLSDGMIIDANESFEQLFGYTNEETVGHSTNELGIWLNSQERDNEVEKLLKLGKLPIHEVTFGTKSGKHINVLFSVELISIGGQLHILSTIMDITERKNAEEQIELERKRLETILETSPSAVIIVEAADGNVSYINNRARQLYGIDISGLNLADAIGRVKSRRIDGSEYLVGEGPSSRALKGKVVRNEEMIMEQADGTVIPILGSAAPIFDSEGKVIAAAAIFDDITDRKKAEKYIKNLLEESQQLNEELEVSNEELQASTEELQTANEELRHQSDELLLTNQALQESEEKYRNIIDNVQDAYFRADKEGKIIMASPSAARMYDFDSPEEMMGLPALSVYKNEEDRDFVLKELNKYGKLNNNEVEAVRKDGTIFWASQNAQYYHDKEGQIQGTESFVRDITEHKRAGKLLQTTLQRFYSILSGMYGAILLVSDNGQVEFANQAFCDFFNLDESPEGLVGLNSGEMIEKIKNGYVHPNEAVIRISEIVDRGQPVKGEEVNLKNGRTCIRDFI
ncbi:MAG: PAS domain S-box protein, partial [Methanobacterium sp.]